MHAIVGHDAALVRETITLAFSEWDSDQAAWEAFDCNGLIDSSIERATGSEVVATARALCENHYGEESTLILAGHVAGTNEDGVAWVRELHDQLTPLTLAPLINEMLWAASRAGLVDIVAACLKNNANPVANVTGYWPSKSDCALLDAGRLGRRAVVEEIVRACVDKVPPLPLDWVLFAAAGTGCLEIAINAIDDGANPDLTFRDSDVGCSEIAEENGHEHMVMLLRNVKRRGRNRERFDS